MGRESWVVHGSCMGRAWVVGRGSWFVGCESLVVGLRSPMYTRHVYILLCCFKCPLAKAVLSAISFMLEFTVHCIFSSHISMYTSYYIALVLLEFFG